LYVAGSLCGLDPQKKVTQYALNTWKTERGLPNNTVLAIVHDHSGYLWLGTAEGLVRFDGVDFTVFNSINTAAFRDDMVNSLYLDRRGVLWIGTWYGKLLSLEGKKFKNHLLDGNISGVPVFSFAEDGTGKLWLGTTDGLFYHATDEGGGFKKYSDFPTMKILCLAKDHANRLLISTRKNGLYSLENGQLKRILFEQEGLASDVNAICRGRNRCLWLGTDNGLYRYQDQRLFHYPHQAGMTDNIMALTEDRDGNLWAGSEGGLYRWYQGAFQSLDTDHGLSSNAVYSLSEDNEGSLWLGTVDGGLVQIRDEKITAITDREGLKGEVFRSLHEDDAGALWIGGYGSFLNRYQNGRCAQFALPPRFNKVEIWSLEKDDDDSLWLGTSFGLLHFRNGRFREIPLPGQNPGIEARCVLKDRSGRMWIGTYGAGLFCRQQGAFKRYTRSAGLPDDRVTSLFEDGRGILWVGCESGMAVMVPGSAEKFSREPFLNDCHVVSFYEDMHGAMWIGTRGHGLKVCRDGQWGTLNSDRGLFDNRIYSIQEDDLGHMWMSSERGIFRTRKDELEKAVFDKNLKISGRLFDESDGMKSRICNNGSPAAWKDGSGRFWFANLAGVVYVDPARLRRNTRIPPVLVEEVVVDNRRLPDAGTSLAAPLILAAGSKRFEFKYTALSFVRSKRIEFKYRLEGYDKEWTSAGSRREAFYNDLRPGRYRFRVQAANADGVWNLAGASFAFYLRPFVYQTWWFMLLSALAFMVMSVLLWQLLQKYLRAVSFWKKKTQIGHFKILETLGTGGMATVYKAQDLLDKKRIVALKVLKEENFHDENQKKRFKHESLITEQLDHPHIVRIIERGEMDDCWYIAMELLRGESLALLIRRGGRLPVGDALDIMLQITDALRAIHAQNIVHRDLKPENIMVSERHGRRHYVKLLDFGLAITPAQSRLTMSGVVMGTIRYLPPERISDGISSPAGDIYAAGIILYEMLTGSKPFWSEATGEVIHRILKTYPLAPKEISREIPQELNALIMAMIAKDPAQRPGLAAIRGELQSLVKKFPARS